ncbi:MAG: flagellar motor protein MotB [Elusimicrobiales bacterium]|jgi:chemotaxis protein MotB|nr:flagellar motor protein MotB [Elusimicrobiales bacterium]
MARFYEREDELENELNRGALWAITYGDLMSYLMIFFMILFAFYSSKNIAAQFSMKSLEDTFGKDTETTSMLFSKHGIQQIAQVEISANKININFSEPILFAPGSDILREQSKPHLKRLAKVFSDLPNPIQIEGHTDARPLAKGAKFRSNWELSAARAFSVLKFMVEQGVAPEKLSAVGYGEFKPIKSNETPEGRSANRRIEINIIRHEI